MPAMVRCVSLTFEGKQLISGATSELTISFSLVFDRPVLALFGQRERERSRIRWMTTSTIPGQNERDPNWYCAMRDVFWTVRNISRSFGVSRAIAIDIQRAQPSFDDARRIADAHQELSAQVGV